MVAMKNKQCQHTQSTIVPQQNSTRWRYKEIKHSFCSCEERYYAHI